MTRPVKTCRTTALLGDAARVMLDAECGGVPVVDRRGRLAGMLTDRDVCLAVAARHESPWEIPVRDVMSAGIVSVPIVDDEGHVKGLISIDDAIRNTGLAPGRLPAEAVVDVLRHICTRIEPELVGAS